MQAIYGFFLNNYIYIVLGKTYETQLKYGFYKFNFIK